MADPRGRPIALTSERPALLRRLAGAAPPAPLDSLDDRALEQGIVDRLGERVEECLVELVLPDHDIVLANHAASLLVVDAAVHRDATAIGAGPVGTRHGDERTAAHRA